MEPLSDPHPSFSLLAEAIGEGLLVVDEADVIRFANSRAVDLLGTAEHDLVDQPASFSIADRAQVDFCRPGGEVIHIEMCVSDLLWEGKPARLVSLRDVTEMVRSLDELRQSEKRFQTLAEVSSQIVWTTDAEGRREASPSWKAFTGQSQEETEQGGWTTAIHPDDQARVAAFWERHIESKDTSQKTYSVDYRLRHASGDWRYVRTRAVPLIDERGDVQSWVGMDMDITTAYRTEAILEDTLERFRATFEQAAVGIAHVGLDGAWLRVNMRLAEIVGYSREELLRCTFQDITHPQDIEQDVTLMQGLLAGEIKTYSIEKRYLRKDGDIVWINLTVSLVRDEEGSPVYFISVIEDISERKQAEAKLLESEERLRAVIDHMNEGLVLSTPEGQVTYWNHAAVRMHDFASREELFDSIPEFEKTFELSTLDGKVLPIEEWPLSRVCSRESLRDYEVRLRHKQRDWERIFRFSGTLIQGAQGDTLAVLTFSDITALKQTEHELRAERDRFARIVETVPGAVHTYRENADGTTCFPYASPNIAKIYGVPPEALVDDASIMARLCHPDDLSHVVTTLEKSAETMDMWHAEFRVLHPERGEIWVDGRSIPQQEDDGSMSWYGVLTDVTTSKRAQEEIRKLYTHLEDQVSRRTAQLQAANEELEAFAYSVSHDLRAPLRAIDGYTQFLQEDYHDLLDSEGQRIAGVVRNEAQRMGQLIDDLLAFSRLGRSEMTLARVDMEGLVESVLDSICSSEQREQVTFNLGPLPAAWGDETLLYQVWQNLLDNALKFSSKREAPLIEVRGSTERVDGKEVVQYSVRDNGAGFNMRYADKLFGVFQRLHSEREFGGTGVGLAIVRRAVQRHGGRVWAESVTGEGTTFYFRLPYSP